MLSVLRSCARDYFSEISTPSSPSNLTPTRQSPHTHTRTHTASASSCSAVLAGARALGAQRVDESAGANDACARRVGVGVGVAARRGAQQGDRRATRRAAGQRRRADATHAARWRRWRRWRRLRDHTGHSRHRRRLRRRHRRHCRHCRHQAKAREKMNVLCGSTQKSNINFIGISTTFYSKLYHFSNISWKKYFNKLMAARGATPMPSDGASHGM